MLINLFIYLFKRKKGMGRDKHPWQSETSIGCLLYAPWPGIEPATFGAGDDTPTTPGTGQGITDLYTDMYSLSPGDYFSFRGIGFWEVMALAFTSLSVNLHDYFRSHRSMVRASS